MKEDNGDQNVGATAWDYPNSQHPYPTRKIYYGNQLVPHPTNEKAKKCHPEETMRAVLKGK